MRKTATRDERMMLQKSIQSFTDHVCDEEGWPTARVEIPAWEDWRHIAIQASDGRTPPEKIYGCAFAGEFYLNPRRVGRNKGRTTVLHELCHINTDIDMVEVLNDPILKNRPELRSWSIESRTEARAKKLSRKYRDAWNQLVNPSLN